jgi:hypothetical protein
LQTWANRELQIQVAEVKEITALARMYATTVPVARRILPSEPLAVTHTFIHSACRNRAFKKMNELQDVLAIPTEHRSLSRENCGGDMSHLRAS